jgi:hypothetical protein
MPAIFQELDTHTTLFSQNKFLLFKLARRGLTFLGVGLFLLPQSSVWFPVSFLLTLGSSFLVLSYRKFILHSFLLTCIAGCAVSGFLSVHQTGAIIVFVALYLFGRRGLSCGLIVLVLGSSFVATFTGYLSSVFDIAWFPLAAPSIVAGFLFLLIFPKKNLWIFISFIIVLLISKTCENYNLNPSTSMVLVSFPILILSLFIESNYVHKKNDFKIKAALILVLICSGWLGDLPRSYSELYFLIPQETGEYEDKFFINYQSALEFSGISALVTNSPLNFKPNSMVVLPEPSNRLMAKNEWEEFKQYAKENHLIVVALGEHTGYKGVAENLNSLNGGIHLNNDLTVPPNNSDEAGQLRSMAFGPFPYNTLLNRGASIKINSLFAKEIISGDGWFSEKDIGDSTWIGDYILGVGERRGRITLGATYSDGARWIYIGDNSFLLNSQIIADPKPLFKLISHSTLWPIFLSDLILALFILSSIIFFKIGRKTCVYKINVALICILLVCGIFLEISIRHKLPSGWKNSNLLESAYDLNNYNNALVDLVGDSNFININLVRHKGYILDSKIGLSQKPEIHFGIVEDEITIGDTKLNNCWRLGSLTTSSGVKINDGQSCQIIGNGEALIGKKSDAAAIKIMTQKQPIIIVLDKAFLGNKSLQEENIEWIKTQIKLLVD